ncbi:MAG: nicotinate phosphoribosyltransferase, partial [Demequina sp.]
MPSQDAASASALTTDQYELTMAASHLGQGRTAPATFDLFVRRLPPESRFLVTAGLADALDYLENLRFTADDVDYLASLGTFRADFLDYLRGFRF